MKLIKTNLVLPAEVAAEVEKALRDHSVVMITKVNIGANFQLFVYSVFASDRLLSRSEVDAL